MKTIILLIGLFCFTTSLISAQNGANVNYLGTLDNEEIHPNNRHSAKKAFTPEARTQTTFKGGMQAMAEFIESKMIYPASAIENGIEGMVLVQFNVSRKGKIQDIEVLKGLGFGCDKLASSIVKQMPKWNPAQLGNRTIDSKVIIPFQFSLK